MKYRRHIIAHVLLTIALFTGAAATVAAAETVAANLDNRLKTLVAQELTARMRAELADQTVDVRISDLRSGAAERNRLSLNGQAFAVVKDDQTELPFEFDAKVNLARQDVDEVSYKFVESLPAPPPAIADNLMKELMTQLSRDYATTNIVISIDDYETARLAGETQYEGSGEVRIGDFEWSRIKFNVKIDSQNNKATKISYEVNKAGGMVSGFRFSGRALKRDLIGRIERIESIAAGFIRGGESYLSSRSDAVNLAVR